MGVSPKPRRRPKLEPISMQELLESSSMQGLVSFLDVRPGDITLPFASLEEISSKGTDPTVGSDGGEGTKSSVGTVPSEGTVPFEPVTVGTVPIEGRDPTVGSDGGEGTKSSVGTVPLEGTVPFEPVTVGTVPIEGTDSTLGVVGTEEEWEGGEDRYLIGASKPFRCMSMADGHSFSEQRLYESLWNSMEAVEEEGGARLISIGWDRMGHLAGMQWKTARRVCFQLIEKLAMEQVRSHDSVARQGTTYRLHGEQVILERRAQQGMTVAVRNRGGVRFLKGKSR